MQLKRHCTCLLYTSPIWMSYEPGSTFKSVTFASALDLHLFDMFKDTYLDRGYEMVEGVPQG